MTAYQVAKGLVLPAPVLGMNVEDPIAAMDPLYATWMCNVDAENQYCQLRGGYRIHATIPFSGGATSGLLLGMGVYGVGSNAKLFAYGQNFVKSGTDRNAVFDCSAAGTATLVYTAADSVADEAVWVNYKSRGSFLIEANPTSNYPTYNGASWSDGWITSSGANKYTVGPSVWYKNRIHTAPSSGSSDYYGAIGQITGDVTTSFPVGDVFIYNNSIRTLGTFSSSDGQVTEEYLAYGNTYGEILVYKGDYPGSSTWQLAGKFLVGEPVTYRSNNTIQFRNDCLIITKTGLYSLRAFMEKGNQAGIEQSVSQKIDTYWTELFATTTIAGGTYSLITGVYSPEQRKIYILVPGHINQAGVFDENTATMFVYNTDTGAWNIHAINMAGVAFYGNLCAFKGDVYFAATNSAGAGIIIKLDTTVFTDEIFNAAGTYRSYTPEIYSAYSVYGEQQAVTRLGSYQPIVDHDLPQFSVKATIDFGLKTAAPTYPNSAAGVSKPSTSVGGEGTFFQYVISGATKVSSTSSTTGFKFYSMNATLQKGGPLS